MNAATSTTQTKPSASKTILLAWLTAGILDIVAAIVVYVYIMARTTTIGLLEGIAGGALGKSAFNHGNAMALVGLCFHFIIALSFTIFYFFIFPYISLLKTQRILSGLLYGIFVWCVMNLAVLPLLQIRSIPTKWNSILIGAAILMFCIGLPISLIVSRYYLLKEKT